MPDRKPRRCWNCGTNQYFSMETGSLCTNPECGVGRDVNVPEEQRSAVYARIAEYRRPQYSQRDMDAARFWTFAEKMEQVLNHCVDVIREAKTREARDAAMLIAAKIDADHGGPVEQELRSIRKGCLLPDYWVSEAKRIYPRLEDYDECEEGTEPTGELDQANTD
ncbi:MAG: hypothetical protein AB7F35_12245 [Acetobacteraceae bacterium]